MTENASVHLHGRVLRCGSGIAGQYAGRSGPTHPVSISQPMTYLSHFGTAMGGATPANRALWSTKAQELAINGAMTEVQIKDAVLRPMGLEDLSKISSWFWNMADVSMFDRTTPLPTNKDALHESWRKSLTQTDPPTALWFMVEDHDGAAMGIGGLQAVNYIHGDAVLPMFISPDARGKGLATAITCRMMDLAFNHLRLHRVTTYYREDNAVTQRVLAKIGFEDEGRQREGWFVGGTRMDIVQAGILAADWFERREAVLKELDAPGRVRLQFAGENNVE